jgi:hypothetical protein
VSQSYPESVHVAFRGVDYQVEVFDPTPGAATAVLASGALKAIGHVSSTAPSTSAKPTEATIASLKSFAKGVGHPIYWLGPRGGVKYELTNQTSGVYIRYLRPSAAIGAEQAFLSVATYPFPHALEALQAVANKPDTATITLPGGGLAIYNKSYPKSIHLAFPGQDYQVEVFSPSAAQARQLVTSGRVSTVG